MTAMEMTRDMVQYYARRAQEYERIYQRRERQADLRALRATIEDTFAGRDVLDIACGTGYFSACAARRARSLEGVDANEETLELARSKAIPNASFRQGDAYDLGTPTRAYSGVLCTFWWSHIPKDRIEAFLRNMHRQLQSGAAVLLADNTYVEGSSTPLVRTDAGGNTYQTRRLESGATYEVLKNFPAADELVAWGMRFGMAVELRQLSYYWCLRYRAR
jgi:demethylmenaquinone methyltransferase/2-methoxy-6-polyprenyl-1,4-benzoquinol methylase